MSSCCCSAASLTSVAFDGGMVLQRCGTHEAQRWTLDGREVARTEALHRLRTVFTSARGQRPGESGPAAPRVRPSRRVRAPQLVTLPADAPTDERLTALLRARGLQGSWAVA